MVLVAEVGEVPKMSSTPSSGGSGELGLLRVLGTAEHPVHCGRAIDCWMTCEGTASLHISIVFHSALSRTITLQH